MNDRVSIVIPARNEAHLGQTVRDLLAKAAGDVEILAMLDGQQPDPQLPNDKRVRAIWQLPDPIGMRPSINAGAQLATGKYLMKCDAHCIFAEGYDATLKANCDVDWLAVPTRHSIHPESWTVAKRDFNYYTLTFPYLLSQYGIGLHAITFDSSMNREINAARAHVTVDDQLSSQGSCWFQHRRNFIADGPLDHERFYFYGESQETGLLRYWLSGRRCVVVKSTWYAHLHKGKDNAGADGRVGRGFYLDVRKKRQCEAEITNICVTNAWPGQTRSFDSLIEHFWPLMSRMTDARYAWPSDWSDWPKHRAAFESRSAEAIPAHT